MYTGHVKSQDVKPATFTKSRDVKPATFTQNSVSYKPSDEQPLISQLMNTAT